MRALRQDDRLRRFLVREPRGSVATHANLIVPTTRQDCAAGYIIMEPTEYPAMSGSNTICVVTVLLETGRVPMEEPEFYQRLEPHARPVIAAHRAEVEGVLREASALVIAGGHVGVLTDVMHLFNVAAFVGSTVIAWSAGAMALTDRIVLFHDRAPQGPGHPEVYGSGLSLLRDVVLLPHARARLLLDDTPRMAVFARRFAPARCVPLEAGTRIDVSSDGTWADGAWPAGIRVLGEDGHVSAREAA